jgi:hypothetical protein
MENLGVRWNGVDTSQLTLLVQSTAVERGLYHSQRIDCLW